MRYKLIEALAGIISITKGSGFLFDDLKTAFENKSSNFNLFVSVQTGPGFFNYLKQILKY